ncbi:MAG: VWA domain-containing protein [Opitutaceae bacterium]|jgi:Ca-activated chloride channel family protein
MTRWTLEDPFWLLLLLALPLVAWLRSRRTPILLMIPFASAWHRPGIGRAPFGSAVMAYLGSILLIVALARPQQIDDKRESQQSGYDIILAMDLSGSMRAEDYRRGSTYINRWQAVKPVIEAFIRERSSDRIGLVVFAGRAYTLSPLTFDHDWLQRQTDRLEVGLLEEGTAIGDGVGVALTRLEQGRKERSGPRQGAFIILMTDGANNQGKLDPLDAARLAKDRGIPIYTIGAGKDGITRMPVSDESGRTIAYRQVVSDLDEPTLREMAAETGGRYFRADKPETTESAFAEIDRTEKIEFSAQTFVVTSEIFAWFAVPGACFLAFSGLGRTRNPNPKGGRL